jgi:DNA-binding response OmpR family regulator
VTGTTELRHVLVVEDNVDVGHAFKVLFEAKGRRVSVARTVAEAIEVASAGGVDLMLLDLTLPDGTGFDVLEAVGRAGSRPRVVVALTGRDEPATIQRCYDLGCEAVLVKPVPSRELMRRADEWLGARSP